MPALQGRGESDARDAVLRNACAELVTPYELEREFVWARVLLYWRG